MKVGHCLSINIYFMRYNTIQPLCQSEALFRIIGWCLIVCGNREKRQCDLHNEKPLYILQNDTLLSKSAVTREGKFLAISALNILHPYVRSGSIRGESHIEKFWRVHVPKFYFVVPDSYPSFYRLPSQPTWHLCYSIGYPGLDVVSGFDLNASRSDLGCSMVFRSLTQNASGDILIPENQARVIDR